MKHKFLNKKIETLIICFVLIIATTIVFLMKQSNSDNNDVLDVVEDTEQKSLPVIQNVENWRDYSESDLETIFFQSDYKEIERFILSKPEVEIKEIIKKCPYIAEDGNVVIAPVVNNIIQDSTTSSILDYAETFKDEIEDEDVKEMADSSFHGIDISYYNGNSGRTFNDFISACVAKKISLSSTSTNFFIGFYMVGDHTSGRTSISKNASSYWSENGKYQFFPGCFTDFNKNMNLKLGVDDNNYSKTKLRNYVIGDATKSITSIFGYDISGNR